MINWYYLVVIASMLAPFLFYKEWTRKKRSRLYGRLIASLLAVLSLLFLAYPYAAGDNPIALNKVVLLTDGYIKDSLDNFLQRNNAGIPIFTDIHSRQYAGSNIQMVTDWNTFTAKHAADTLHVFGDGFNDETLALLNPHPIIFHSTPALPGISNIYWKQQLEPGEQLVVQGSYENNGTKNIKIVLQAFGSDKDSIFIAAGTRQNFELHTIPVHTGNAVYSLIATAGNDTLQKEPVPVAIQPKLPLQLLIVSSSPDFDNTYLKNHLSQHGYQVTVTTTVSTNKTEKQFLNMPVQEAAGRLTADYLNKFDVVMADQEVLQKITPAELAAIRSAVQEKGTGLIIKLNGQKNAAFYARFFPVKARQLNKESFLLLRNTVTDSNVYKIKITDPVSINYQAGTQIILQDEQSNIYASGVLYGSGKIIATTLQNTFSIALAGDKTSYQQLWWLLLNKAAKKIYPDEAWRTNPFIPFINNPVQMRLEKTELPAPVAMADQTSIYLTQDPLLTFAWKGIYWPVKGGWQPLPRVNAVPGSWYVYKAGDWQQLVDHQYMVATKKYAAMHPVTFTQKVQAVSRSPVNMHLYLLIIFFGACVFLWVEQKSG